jgi:hypothetical protein
MNKPPTASATWLTVNLDRIVATVTMADDATHHTYTVEVNGDLASGAVRRPNRTNLTAEEFVKTIDFYTGHRVLSEASPLETAGMDLYLELSALMVAKLHLGRAEANAFSTLVDTMGMEMETTHIN